MAALIRRLSEDEIAVRAEAEIDLFRIGQPAVRQLTDAAPGSDAETAGRCRDILDRLARPDIELTGLSLLVFLGAGYSHLSKDVFEGFCLGQVVRRGLDGLRSRQGKDGAFDSNNIVANAIAALAMSEAYGLTGSNLWKETAEKGLVSLERVIPKDARETVWKALAARSGMIGEAWKAGTGPVRALHERLAILEGTNAQVGTVILEAWLDRRRGGPRAEALAALDPWTLDEETLLLCSLGMRSGWRSWEEPCKAWLEKVKVRVIRWSGSSRCGLLGLSEGIRSSGFRILTLEAYYRYGNSLSSSHALNPFER